MTTKTLTGHYAAGYNLNPAYATLDIAASAYVGGTGVTTSASTHSRIVNLGEVISTGTGITLADGGSVTNGSATNSTATIAGGHAIIANGDYATLTNNAVIGRPETYTFTVGGTVNGYGTLTSLAVIFNAGGGVSNSAHSSISGGVSIGGGYGTVTNTGTIDSPGYNKTLLEPDYKYQFSGHTQAVVLDTGVVTNRQHGEINGVAVTSGSGTVFNYGLITSGATRSQRYYYQPFPYPPVVNHVTTAYDASIALSDGGTVFNQGYIDQGVSIGGAAGLVVNYGAIGLRHAYYSEAKGVTTLAPGVDLTAGGEVANGEPISFGGGASANPQAWINGVSIAGGAGTVLNYGTIGPSSSKGAEHTAPAIGVYLGSAGARVNNGGAEYVGEVLYKFSTIAGVVGLSLAASGTVTNFATIESTGGPSGVAVSFGSSADVLVEEGTGVLIGKVVGGGGTLILDGSGGAGTITGLGSVITGFTNIQLGQNADWSFSGQNTIVSNQTLSAHSGGTFFIGVDGTLTNHGVIFLPDILLDATFSTGGEIYNATDGTLTIAGTIEPARGAQNAAIVNAGLMQTEGGVCGVNLDDTGRIQVLRDIEGNIFYLEGAANTIAGAVTGPGTLEFKFGSTTLNKGASLGVAEAEIFGAGTVLTIATSLVDSHTFIATGANSLVLDSGDILKLSGPASFNGTMVDGAGSLITSGAASVSRVTLGGTAKWINSGSLTATGALTVGDAAGDVATFTNQAAGVFDITGLGSIGVGTSASSSFVNQGLLEKTSGVVPSVVAVAVNNTGTVLAAHGVLDLTGAVSGAGALDIGAGATLEFGGAVASAGHAAFTGAKGVLQLDNAATFAAAVSGFAAGETIDVRGAGFGAGTTLSYSGTTASGTLTVTNGANVARIALLGQYAAGNFKAASDGHGGTDITFLATPAPALATPSH